LQLVREWSRKNDKDPYSENSHHHHDSYTLQSNSLHSSMSRLSLHNSLDQIKDQGKYRNGELRRANSLRHDLLRGDSISLPTKPKELTLDIFQF
jgi:hypothetical protein